MRMLFLQYDILCVHIATIMRKKKSHVRTRKYCYSQDVMLSGISGKLHALSVNSGRVTSPSESTRVLVQFVRTSSRLVDMWARHQLSR